jgi:hypothetical protein
MAKHGHPGGHSGSGHPSAPPHSSTPPHPSAPPRPGTPPHPGQPPQGHQPDDPAHPNRPGQDDGKREHENGGKDDGGKGKDDKDKPDSDEDSGKSDKDEKDEPESDSGDSDDSGDSEKAEKGEGAPVPGAQDGGSAGSQYAPGGFDNGSAITEQLQPPEDTSGDDIQDLVKDAGVEVLAVEWIFQQITGKSLTQEFIEPITGDFSKMSADAEAWRNIAEAMKAFSGVMTGNEKILGDSWTGPASLAHKAYVDLGWRAALAAEAGIAELIAKGFELLSDTSKKLAAKALDLLKSLIDRLLVMAAEACVPIAGWVADAITGLSEVLPLIDALISIVDMIKDIVQKVGDLWDSIKDLGSQLAKIKDISSLSDAIDVGKGIAGDVGDIKDNATGIKDDLGEAKDAAKDGIKETRENHADNKDHWDNRRNRTPAHSGSGRISGSIDD